MSDREDDRPEQLDAPGIDEGSDESAGTADSGDRDPAEEEFADDELAEVAQNEAELELEADELGAEELEAEELEAEELEAEELESDDAAPETDALVSRLRLIGEQPLAERAASLAQLHDELRERLESGDDRRR